MYNRFFNSDRKLTIAVDLDNTLASTEDGEYSPTVSLVKEDVIYLIAYILDRGQIPKTKSDIVNSLHVDNVSNIINHSANLDNEDSMLEQAELIFNKLFPRWKD